MTARFACLSFFLIGALYGLPCTAEDASVTVDASKPGRVIPANVLGLHMVYCWQPDSVYADGRIADWAKSVHAGVARYPGGTVVKAWDWHHPSGTMKGDPWDPNYKSSENAPPGDYMDLDEYLAFCKRSGCQPMVGVNCTSGYLYHRMPESIARAAACVKYCRDHGSPVHYWYIGNETEGLVGGWANYLKICRQHADAMRAVDPTICILINNNGVGPTAVKEAIDVMGPTLGGIEFHNKWKEGGKRGEVHPGTFAQWQQENPASEVWRELGDISYAERLAPLRAAAQAAGRPDLVFADNEWGLGGKLEGFDKYTKSLVLIDQLQGHIIGGFDMACLWDMAGKGDNMMMDSTRGYTFNPIAQGYELVSTAVGQHFLTVTSSNHLVYGFGCVDDKAQSVQIFLLNKTSDAQNAVIQVTGLTGAMQNAQGETLTAPGDALTPLPVSLKDATATCSLSGLSYSRVTVALAGAKTN